MILQDLLTGPSFLTQTLQSTSLFLLIGLSKVADGDHPMNKGLSPCLDNTLLSGVCWVNLAWPLSRKLISWMTSGTKQDLINNGNAS